MGWFELIVVAFFALLMFGDRFAILLGATCPECRQATLRRTRDLGEEWGTYTRLSTCPACGSHFRHDADRLTKTGTPVADQPRD